MAQAPKTKKNVAGSGLFDPITGVTVTPSRRVTRALEQIVERRGIPQSIRCNNGPERRLVALQTAKPPSPELNALMKRTFELYGCPFPERTLVEYWIADIVGSLKLSVNETDCPDAKVPGIAIHGLPRGASHFVTPAELVSTAPTLR